MSSAEALIEATDDEFRHEMLHTHSVLCTYNTTEQSEEEKKEYKRTRSKSQVKKSREL